MNRALLYLWLALLKRRTLHFCRGLRRPTTLIGFVAVLALVLFLFHYRRQEVVGHLLERKILIGAALVMLCGSLFRGFLERGLVFDPADVEFLFTSPFTRRQIILYRLFSNYLFALIQSVVFGAVFYSHFTHPLLAAGCLFLFQLACFHISTAASIYAGTISDQTHHRLRWMMLGAFFFLTALYLRVAWDLKLAPKFLSTPLAQLLFYPAVTLPDAVSAPGLHYWSLHFIGAGSSSFSAVWTSLWYLAFFGLGTVATLWFLLHLKGDLFEPALGSTTRQAEKRLRLKQGRAVATPGFAGIISFGLPRLPLFRGLGAVVWKNLVTARRSKRELFLVGAFAFVYTGFTVALLYIFHSHYGKQVGRAPADEALAFDLGIALFLAVLTFFLQRLVPFDFRRDGHHLLTFRTLPVTAFGLVLAEITVPTLCCLALQAPCVVALLFYARFSWIVLLLVLLAFPAVALGLNSIWNLHYLLTATKRAAGQFGSPSAVGTLVVVCLSFLVFFPAGWSAIHVGRHFYPAYGLQLPIATGLAVQYAIDFLVLLLLARIFHRFQASRDG